MITYKFKKNRERIGKMHSLILMIMLASMEWCKERNLPYVITDTVSTKEEDEILGRVSETHRDGRAYDFSVKRWKPQDMQDYKDWLQKKFKGIGAFISEQRPDVLIDFHGEGENLHGHVQIHRRFFLDKWF